MNDFKSNKRQINPLFNLNGGAGVGDSSADGKPSFSLGGGGVSAGDDAGVPSFTLDDEESVTPAVNLFTGVSAPVNKFVPVTEEEDEVFSLGDEHGSAGDSGSVPVVQSSPVVIPVEEEEEGVFSLGDEHGSAGDSGSVPVVQPSPVPVVPPVEDVLSLGDEDGSAGDVDSDSVPAVSSGVPSFGVPAFVVPPVAVTPVDESSEEEEVLSLGDEGDSAGDSEVAPVVQSSPVVIPPVAESVIPEAPSFGLPKPPVFEDVLELPDEVVESVPPVVEEPVITPAPSFGLPKPPVVKRVNPLFADPDEKEGEAVPAVPAVGSGLPSGPLKRRANPLFDYKQDKPDEEEEAFVLEDEDEEFSGFSSPVAVPSSVVAPTVPGANTPVKKNVPGALMDSGDAHVKNKKPATKSSKKPARRGFQLQERDITLLRFLVKYQFSYVDALARLVDSSPNSIQNRMRILEEHDLVKREVLAVGATLWQAKKAGIALCNMSFTERKKAISFATIPHSIGLVNLAAELEREAADAKDVLGLADLFGEEFPVKNRFPGGIRLYGDEADAVDLVYGEMTISEREVRQAQKRYRGGRSSAEMRELVQLAVSDPRAPELEEGNESMFVVYGSGGKTGEHVPDLIVTRPRNADGSPNHFAVELEMTAKPPAEWKRILRAFRENGQMYSRIYYFTPDRPIANMLRNANEDVGLENLIIRKYTPKNKRQPFKG